jgi:RNA polymerase sigma-70 factor, ECF subfamily
LGRSNVAAIDKYRSFGRGDEASDSPTARPGKTRRPLTVAEWELAQIERSKVDPREFAPLYEAYADLVWRYAVKRLGNDERAADATSQVFIKVIAALPNYKPAMRGEQTTFRSWLMMIARNVVIDEARKHRPTADLDAPATQPWLVDRSRSPEEDAIASEEQAMVRKAVAKLPEKQRRIVELRAMGLKVAEIAEMMGMTVAGIRTSNHRAYTRLRELLGDDKGRRR